MRRVPLPPTGAPPELVQEAITALRAGLVVALPTETVYGLVADPSDPSSSDRIRSLKERPLDLVFTHHIADREAVDQFVADLPRRVERLLERYWPGPLTVVLPGRTGGTVGIRLPAHDFTRAVIRAHGPSLFLTSVNHSGAPPLNDPAVIEREFGDRIDLLFDAGVPPLREASTVVRYTRSDRGPELGEIEVLRIGTLSAADVLETAARRILFVCTGNTCRSPLAAALARRGAARRLGTTDELVLSHGLAFESAGIGAYPGQPASDGSVDAAQEVGLDLTAHRASTLTAERVRDAERVFCLGPAHLVAARAIAPDAADRIELLDPSGGGVPDPFAGDLDEYRRTRDVISQAVDARIAELIPEVG